MLIHTKGYYQSTLFRAHSVVTHGFSARTMGDMRDEKNRQIFLRQLNIDSTALTMCAQVHGNDVRRAVGALASHIDAADGLIMQTNDGTAEPVALAVRVADCVPLLFVDTKMKIIAAAHAGWRGTIGHIAANVVTEMKKAGSDERDIVVALGPHIGMCCYDVPRNRARQFQDVYGSDSRLVSQIDGTWHLNLGFANVLDLLAAGIPKEHIDMPICCTSCQIDQFFSYRKDTKETFGEILGVVAV